MLRLHQRASSRNIPQRGVVAIEFLLIFPFLLLLFFATFDINQFLRSNQVASVLSRESAARALRRCSTIVSTRQGEFDHSSTQNSVGQCLSRVSSEINAALPANAGFAVRLTVFRVIDDPNTPGQDVVSISAASAPKVNTFYLSDGAIKSGGRTVVKSEDLSARRVVAAAEVEYGFTPFIISSFDLGGTTISRLFNPVTRFIDATIV